LGAKGEKLSKQNGAQALDLSDPVLALHQAAAVLGLPAIPGSVPEVLGAWMAQWKAGISPCAHP
jgi:glutamyl-Q tRNA(Asp) synthetase